MSEEKISKQEDPMLGLRTSDYSFDLPQELIAQDPLEDRADWSEYARVPVVPADRQRRQGCLVLPRFSAECH